ncbi:MAG: ribbon-helix-helix protein, CopG family [Cyanobacteria bacterium M_surface_10_m2_119]|nr:ribbon-helix-helix protein, CopG family [Cyanobacteria bacterium M_surface_10_m2_119]
MALSVRLSTQLEKRLDLLARQLGKTRSACIREAITHDLSRQSEHLAQLEPPHWSEQVPDWSDWTTEPPAPGLTADPAATPPAPPRAARRIPRRAPAGSPR